MEIEAAEGVGSEGAELETGAPVESGELTEGATGEAVESSGETPELYSILVDGHEQQVTLEEALKGHMRQADYTRKTQELAREKQEVAQWAAFAQALERDPRTTLASLAGALGIDFGPGQVAQGPVELDPLESLNSKVDALTSTLSATQRQAAEQAAAAQQMAQTEALIQQEIAGLKEIHGDFDERELATWAVKNETPNLRAAYMGWQFELQNAAKVAERNRQIEAKRKAQVVTGGSNPAAGSVTEGTTEKMTAQEAIRRAIAAHQ